MAEVVKSFKCFNGMLKVYEHNSATTGTKMTFAIFHPPAVENPPCLFFLAGLTCDHLRFTEKASSGLGAAAQAGIAMVFPDTSPRGLDIPGIADSWDFGNAAGYYLDATEAPYAENFKMYTYITSELHTLVGTLGVNSAISSITGHSMGGLGALNLGIRNPQLYRSISAFAPICNPSTSDWGKSQFTRFLGSDESKWAAYDPSELVKAGQLDDRKVLVHTGTADFALDKLNTGALQEACSGKDNVSINMVEGYGHDYYFITSYAAEHVEFHASILKA